MVEVLYLDLEDLLNRARGGVGVGGGGGSGAATPTPKQGKMPYSLRKEPVEF